MGPVGSKRYVTAVCHNFEIEADEEKTKHVICSLRIVEGPETGRDLVWRGYLTEKAAPYTLQALKAMGWHGSKLSRAMQEGLGSLKVNVRLVVEEYNGKISEKADRVYEPKAKSFVKTPVDAATASSFDALFEAIAANVEGPANADANKAPPLPPRAESTTAAPKADDEIPF
jgi:hypothetical protein